MNPYLRYFLTGILLLIFQISSFAQFSAFKDNTLYQDVEGDRSNGQGEHFFAGRTGGEGPDELRRGLIAFDIAGQVPEGATITSVFLRLNMSRSNAGPVPVSLHRVLKDWGEADSDAPGNEGAGTAADTNDVTWLHTFFNSQFWANPGGDFDTSASASQSVSGIGFYTWGSTEQMVDDVQTWLDSPSTNFGWLVRGDESSPTTAKRFDSRENATANNRPVLQVNFTLPNVPPVAVNDSTGTNEDNAVIIDVLANDSDSDGTLDPATVTIVDNPTSGTITNINTTTGAVTYDPTSNFNGNDSFTYTVKDNDGATSDTATVLVTVLDVNDAPTAVDDSTGTNEDTAVQVDVLNNDSDIDGTLNPATVTVTSGPGSGSISDINATTGVITYLPGTNFNGTDTFTYTVEDDDGTASDTATVSVTVLDDNDPPIAVDDSTGTNEDTAVQVDVLNNDSDIDGTLNPATVTVTSGPGSGSISDINATTGVITYLPGTNFNGTETFTYTVEDNDGAASDTAMVTVTVLDVNDAPVATDDSTTTNEETAVPIDILANDSDIDGTLDASSVAVIDGPDNGSITDINTTTGVITYEPNPNFNGSDTLSYTVNDDDGDSSNPALVIVNVDSENDPPVIASIPPVSFNEDDTLRIPQSAWQEFVSDPDNDVNSLSYDLLPGSDVSVTLDSFNIVFSAPPDWFGVDTLTLIVSDGQLADTALIFITVYAVNDAPTITDLPDSVSFDNNTDLELVLADQVNDADLPGDSLRWSFAVSNDSVQFSFTAETQTLTLQAPAFKGQVTLTITVSDDSAANASDSIHVTVTEIPNSLSEFTPGLPDQFSLEQNYPNPFNPMTRIRFSLPQQSEVVISVFDLLGKKVDVLVNRRFTAGTHILNYDGSALTSGVYFYMIEAGQFRDVQKMILLK